MYELQHLPAAPASKLVPNVLLRSPLDYINEAKRGTLITGQLRVSIKICPGTCPGEVTSVSLLAVAESTRDAAVTSDKPTPIGVGYGCYGLHPTVGGIIVSHCSATAHLKLGSSQLVRC